MKKKSESEPKLKGKPVKKKTINKDIKVKKNSKEPKTGKKITFSKYKKSLNVEKIKKEMSHWFPYKLNNSTVNLILKKSYENNESTILIIKKIKKAKHPGDVFK